MVTRISDKIKQVYKKNKQRKLIYYKRILTECVLLYLQVGSWDITEIIEVRRLEN